ncbi:hypothetical protein ANN_12320 [Periplaneta americana]|uniref:Uncharacterized protein n=1 Tax=Periplaneta americana TaxID=6978 RepID=A0ABQ8TIQ5_PERAM|nr:hypothetical protein ANN_12320 [Periplaneta americana]
MAGLCEGDNEPPGSLKASKARKVTPFLKKKLLAVAYRKIRTPRLSSLEEDSSRGCSERTGTASNNNPIFISAVAMTNMTSAGGISPKEEALKNKAIAEQQEEEEDDPISQAVGEFGRWQLQLTFFLSLFNIPCTWHIFAPTFQQVSTDFWCARPPNLSELSVDVWKNMSHTIEFKVLPHFFCFTRSLSSFFH